MGGTPQNHPQQRVHHQLNVQSARAPFSVGACAHTRVCVRAPAKTSRSSSVFTFTLCPVPCCRGAVLLCGVVWRRWSSSSSLSCRSVVTHLPPPLPAPLRPRTLTHSVICVGNDLFVVCSYVTPSRETGLSRSRAVRRDGSCPALALQELKETQNRKLEQFQINSTNFTTPQHSKASQLPLP